MTRLSRYETLLTEGHRHEAAAQARLLLSGSNAAQAAVPEGQNHMTYHTVERGPHLGMQLTLHWLALPSFASRQLRQLHLTLARST